MRKVSPQLLRNELHSSSHVLLSSTGRALGRSVELIENSHSAVMCVIHPFRRYICIILADLGRLKMEQGLRKGVLSGPALLSR